MRYAACVCVLLKCQIPAHIHYFNRMETKQDIHVLHTDPLVEIKVVFSWATIKGFALRAKTLAKTQINIIWIS